MIKSLAAPLRSQGVFLKLDFIFGNCASYSLLVILFHLLVSSFNILAHKPVHDNEPGMVFDLHFLISSAETMFVNLSFILETKLKPDHWTLSDWIFNLYKDSFLLK